MGNREHKLVPTICLFINEHLDEIEEFMKDLDKIEVSDNRFYMFTTFIERMIDGKTIFLKTKGYVDFYNKYSELLNEISQNKSRSIGNFLHFLINEKDDYYFYIHYVKKYNSYLDRIGEIIEKIKSLGFMNIIIDEEEKFEDEYHIYSTRSPFSNFDYLDNIQLIPTYEKDVIRYKGVGSNYLLSLSLNLSGNPQILHRFSEARLNNLLFDPALLPKSLSKEDTYDMIFNAKNKKSELYKIINDYVSLGVGTHDLIELLISFNEYIDSLQTIDDKSELERIVKEINVSLDNLKSYIGSLIDMSSKDNSEISQEYIADQVKASIKRREMLRYDID